jgi:hypothetical protein
MEVAVFTRAGVERIMRFAFELARPRPRKLLTVVTKSNAQRHGMVLWDEICARSRRVPDVTWDKMLVDAMTTRMVTKPGTPRHHRRHQPARRHPLRPRRGAGRLARHRRRPRTSTRARPLDVRADPRLGLRHHRQGHRQPDRHLLDRGDDARAPRRGPPARRTASCCSSTGSRPGSTRPISPAPCAAPGGSRASTSLTRGYGSGDTVNKVAAGTAAFGVADISAVMAARARQNAPVRSIMQVYTHSPHSLFVLRSSGITNFRGLEGRRIGITPGNSHRLYFPEVARRAGTNPDASPG